MHLCVEKKVCLIELSVVVLNEHHHLNVLGAQTRSVRSDKPVVT